MKTMASLLVFAVLGCSLALAAAAEEATWANEVEGGVVVQFPGTGDFDLYDLGLGAEIQYRNWSFDPLGLAFAVGFTSWEANEDCHKLGDVHTDFDGSVTTIPIGVSLLYYLYGTQSFSLIAEAGVRYLVTDADIDFTRIVETEEGEERLPSSLEVDDSVLGLVALEADYFVNEQFLVFGGVGYQQDLQRGGIDTPTGPLRDNEFTSLFLRLGGKIVF